MFHLSAKGPYGIVFEHLQDAFNPQRFCQWLHLVSSIGHVAMGCFIGSIACVFSVVKLLVLSKLLSGIKSIAMGEVLYGQSIELHVFNSMMCFLLMCVIGLVWQLGAGVRWCKVFKLFWMSIPIGQCYKWTWKMHFITFCLRPSSKNFMQQEVSCLCTSLLFVLFMLGNCPYFLIIIPSKGELFVILLSMGTHRLWGFFLF